MPEIKLFEKQVRIAVVRWARTVALSPGETLYLDDLRKGTAVFRSKLWTQQTVRCGEGAAVVACSIFFFLTRNGATET